MSNNNPDHLNNLTNSQLPMSARVCIVKTCKDCGNTFEITNGEVNYLNTHNLAIFERCAECRKRRKDQREAKEAAKNQESPASKQMAFGEV